MSFNYDGNRKWGFSSPTRDERGRGLRLSRVILDPRLSRGVEARVLLEGPGDERNVGPDVTGERPQEEGRQSPREVGNDTWETHEPFTMNVPRLVGVQA